MKNPCEFDRGDKVISVYDFKIYEVVEPNKKGMAKLRLLECEMMTDWNACNNRHFEKFTGQYKIDLNPV